MVTSVTMRAGGGAVCCHCGTVRINEGDQCLEVTNGRGGMGYIAIGCKEKHPWTAGVTPAPAPPETKAIPPK